MCGIAGQVTDSGRGVDRRRVARMARALGHRGPDGEGFWFGRSAGLGHRRLSLVGLANGQQPLSNDEGTLQLVCNGEIYNHEELRASLRARGHRFKSESDNEVILHLYEELGHGCLERLVGMFAFAIWDERDQSLFLARDRFGVKPLHYFEGRDSFLFSSEAKALFEFPEVPDDVDTVAVDQYLGLLSVLEPRSIFSAIRKLPAGHFLVRKGGKTRIKRYWDIRFPEAPSAARRSRKARLPRTRAGTESEIAEMSRLLLESVRMTLRADAPIGVFLSGGIDSSILTALAAKEHGPGVPTFSVAFEEGLFDESRFSRAVARKFRTRHHELLVPEKAAVAAMGSIGRQMDEPFADSSAIPTYLLAKLARGSVKAVVCGEGADELFAGYGWQQRAGGKAALADLAVDTRRTVFCEELRSRVLAPKAKAAQSTSRDWFRAHRHEERVSRGLGPLDQALYFDAKFYLPSDLLVKVDRMTMLHSLEARVPFLNHPFAEFAAGIGAKRKLRGDTRKAILRDAFGHLLPPAILSRSKMGFAVPMDQWLWKKGPFRKMVCDVLFSAAAKRRGHYRFDLVERMIGEHDRLLSLNGYRLWTLFVLELWHQEFAKEIRATRSRGDAIGS